jgi:hypothetical protein
MVHVHVHGACLCPCCMSMSMVQVYVHGACCTSRSKFHIHVHAACPSSMSMLLDRVHGACTVHVHAVCLCPWCIMSFPSCMSRSMVYDLVHVYACPFCISVFMLHVTKRNYLQYNVYKQLRKTFRIIRPNSQVQYTVVYAHVHVAWHVRPCCMSIVHTACPYPSP